MSTHEQNPTAQHDALTIAGCERIYTDHASGKLASRPQLDAALAHLCGGDVLVVTKLDRLGRSVKNLVELSLDLHDRQVGLAVLGMGIDTTTPAGRMFFHLMAGIAEFERDLISERTTEGLATARARGKKGGRKLGMSALQLRQARTMYDSGDYTVAAIAEAFGISPATLYRCLQPPGWWSRLEEHSRQQILSHDPDRLPHELLITIAHAGGIMAGAYFPGHQTGPSSFVLSAVDRRFLQSLRPPITHTTRAFDV